MPSSLRVPSNSDSSPPARQISIASRRRLSAAAYHPLYDSRTASAVQRPGGQPPVLRAWRQRVLEPPRGLRIRRPHRPEPAERPGELEVAEGVVLSHEIERGAKVVVLLVEPVRPDRASESSIGIGPRGIGSLGESEVVRGVPAAHDVALTVFPPAAPWRTRGSSATSRTARRSGGADSCRRATAGCPGRPPRPARPPRVCSRRERRRAW